MSSTIKGFLRRAAVRGALLDALKTLALLAAAALLSCLLRVFGSTENFVSMVFILSVFLVARFTKGYVYGIVASLLSVLGVNFAFTYPYYSFNFTLAGYPVAVISMLAVSLTTSALTTQAKRAEAVRLEAEREKTRGNLLRAVSHDLRTPLTSILGATSAVIENDRSLSPSERLTLLCGVRDDAQWLIRMVENLLTITRMDGETRIQKQGEAIEEVVSEAVLKFQKSYPQQELSLAIPDQLLIVPMDGVLIAQVLINLLENAAQHGRGGEILLEVGTEGDEVCFSVSDRGAGIAPELLPRLFDGHFKRTEGAADSRRNMGIGLSVCNTIIKAHNGRMSAQNLERGGARLSFRLPLE